MLSEISLQSPREDIERSKLGLAMFDSFYIYWSLSTCCTLGNQKNKQNKTKKAGRSYNPDCGGSKQLSGTMVVGNNWVILLIMSTLPRPVLMCSLILNQRQHSPKQNMVQPLQENYTHLSEWSYTFSTVNMATSHFAHPKMLRPLLNTNNNNTQESQIRDKVAYLTQTAWVK